MQCKHLVEWFVTKKLYLIFYNSKCALMSNLMRFGLSSYILKLGGFLVGKCGEGIFREEKKNKLLWKEKLKLFSGLK